MSIRRTISVAALAALGTVSLAMGSPQGSIGVAWLGDEGATDAAFEAELVNVLLERLAEGALPATVVDPQNAMVRRALADGELEAADVTVAAEPVSLARLGRGLGVDWVVGLDVESLSVTDELASAEVAVTGLLVDALTGGHTELRAEKRAGETSALEDVPARAGSPSRILACAMAYRVCEAVVAGVAGGREGEGPPREQPGEVGPTPGPSPLTGGPTGIADETVRLEWEIAQRGASAELCMRLGDAYLADGQWESARAEFQKAARLDRTLPDPYLRLGDMATDRGLWQDAIKEYQEALELDPASIAARIAIARALEQANQRATAIKELEVATELDADNGSLWVKLGDLHSRLEQSNEAEEAYLAALRAANPDRRACGRLGQLYAQRGRFKEALTYYVKAAKERDTELPQKLDERHYRATMAAGDEALAEAMRASRDALQAFHDGETTREEAYEAFVGFAERSGDISRFAEALEPPRGLQKQHALRLLAYALVEESDLTIQQYIGTNDTADLDYACQVRDEAVKELERLLKGNQASR
ncbi:MAG: tetratricopeptide repeat protein [Armatimonadota bacterium]|jgi:tetratricopeptide (TPR) repeat protein